MELITDEGLVGIGETDVNPWMAKTCVEAPGTHTMGQSLVDLLKGFDPLAMTPEALWRQLYLATAMNGRRGLLIHVLGAIDMALWDLRGKALKKPCHALMGNPVRTHITPYASLQPETTSFEAYKASMLDWAHTAVGLGFRAIKVECTLDGPYAHMGLRLPMYRATELLEAVRSVIGPDIAMMVDVQYAFPDADSCLDVIRDWAGFNLTFLETPLMTDDLEQYRRLSEEQPIPIAAGEWAATHYELSDLMKRAGVQVIQPDIGRVGGFTEVLKTVPIARANYCRIVPHAWKTGIAIQAAAHLATVSPECAFIEFLPRALCSSQLRKELTLTEPDLKEGLIPIPVGPGLGLMLNWDVIARFEESARALYGK